MLRASAERTGTPLDLRAVVDSGLEPRLPVGARLRDLASALVIGRDLHAARAALVDAAGPAAAAAATAVCANFQMMNRVVDAAGLPVPATAHCMERRLGIG